jgi:cytochrome oxidase Cu insertion factor (SCO1/SenC/PrrC family)
MAAPPRKLGFMVWMGIVITLMILLLAYMLAQLRFREAIGDSLPTLGQVAPFTLTNQNNQVVTLTNLLGEPWVADIIFTRCAGPCPRMTRQMRELQQSLPPASQARLVTLTTDPGFDNPAVLRDYAARYQADPKNWMFLTGTKQQIAALAIDSLKLTAIEKIPEERQDPQDLFIHSTIFVVVDRHGRLRGIFETGGENTSWAESKKRLLAAVRRLELEK